MRVLFTFFALLLIGLAGSTQLEGSLSKAATKGVKIRYNGKTHRNKSKKMTVKYNSKTVSQKSYKALIINKYYMAPYADVFKKGVKASCKYSKKEKTLTISKNQVTIKMKVGSKSATVNDKKVKLPTAPLSVRYMSKKKTKILVPVNYIAKTLHLSCKKSGSTISLQAPLILSYDGSTTYYTGVQGSIYYNHKTYSPASMPVIKLSGSWYIPAEETMDSILNLKYEYNSSTGKITITNEDLKLSLVCQNGSNQAKLNGKPVTLSAPVKQVKNVEKNTNVLCLPAAGVLKQLNYTRNWNKTGQYYLIQSKQFFAWKKELTKEQQSSTETNYIYAMESFYAEQSGMGSVNIKISGSLQEIMKTLTVRRNGNIITVTMQKSSYLLEKNQFSNFGEIISKLEVTSEGDTVTLTLTCEQTAEYSYIIQNGTLELNILQTYGTSQSDLNEYSLTIPKPANVTISNVTNQDWYTSKKFQIMIAGNHAAFFQSHPVIINNNTVKSVAITTNSTHTIITVTTSSLQGYKIFERGDNFVVSMGAPKNIYRSIVVLDAGHGGYDPGAQNKGTNEKDLTYQILYTLMKQYASQNAPDIKIYWTRTTDTYVSLANRAAFAQSVGADAFISLHMNSANNSSANGTEVYYSVSNNSKSFSNITSKIMANLFRNKLISDLGLKNRGTKTAAYYVIKHNTVPAILIELGFISGSTDYNKLTNSEFQQKAAKSIYDGIVSMFAQYPTGR
ncbi:MAG: N-acetylmuramoyl-L-alanine amidase [Lachnospiraceae bacterium]|nr:N-acetylmuramoyl-L-alanine amidase [Lachnospiraceae bacterium]